MKKILQDSDLIRKKIQYNLVNKYEYFKQAHQKMNKLSSMTLGVMTSSVY